MASSPDHQQDDQDREPRPEALKPSFPAGRVKKIVKLDRDIKKLNSEALRLISLAAELFLGSLADRAWAAAVAKKCRVIKVEHLRAAVRGHPPTADFLLDCLPEPTPLVVRSKPTPPAEKPLPPGSRRIEDFFGKPPVEPQ